ncbi:MAG: hypothetical protein GY820_21640, partial [Gammaproteobacteria bacterium]|nr:hypothetical protein [Gammaproteobacteria bacterium]
FLVKIFFLPTTAHKGYSIPPLLRGLWDERKICEKLRKSGGPRNSGDAEKVPGYGIRILAIILNIIKRLVKYSIDHKRLPNASIGVSIRVL